MSVRKAATSQPLAARTRDPSLIRQRNGPLADVIIGDTPRYQGGIVHHHQRVRGCLRQKRRHPTQQQDDLFHFKDFKYSTTASASSCDILYVGMGGSAGLPLGPFPVLRKLTSASSPHFCHSRPGLVRSGEVLCQPLTGSIGWIFRTA